MTYRDTRYDTDLDGQVESAKNAEFLGGYTATDLARPKNAAKFTSTDTSTDINQSSWTTISWDSEISVDADYTHSTTTNPGEVTFDNAGTYRVYVMLTYDDNGNARINPGIKFAINGTRRDALGLSGYSRANSGHNEASNYLQETIDVSAGDTLTVQTSQYGNTGTVTLRANESVLEIEQVSKTVAIADDADTVDGYSSSELLKATEANSNSFDTNSDLILRGIGPSSDYNVAVQDGNGRVHHYWNVEEGTQNVIKDNEGAAWLRFDGGSVRIRTHAGSSGDAGSPPNWDEVFDADGNGIYEFGDRIATRNWVNNNADADTVDGFHAADLVDVTGDTMTGILKFDITSNDFFVLQDGSGGSNPSPYTLRYDSPRDFRLYSNSASDVLTADHNGTVDIPNGLLKEKGDRVATRSWVNTERTAYQMTVDSTAPSNPNTKDIWIDTS
jgi:hypothetical protein